MDGRALDRPVRRRARHLEPPIEFGPPDRRSHDPDTRLAGRRFVAFLQPRPATTILRQVLMRFIGGTPSQAISRRLQQELVAGSGRRAGPRPRRYSRQLPSARAG